MKQSTEAAWKRAMKIQEVMLRAMAKRITWWQAAEIIGIGCRQMRCWRRRYEEDGYDGLRDRRRGRVSEKRVPLGEVEEVLRLYQEQYSSAMVKAAIEANHLRVIGGISPQAYSEYVASDANVAKLFEFRLATNGAGRNYF